MSFKNIIVESSEAGERIDTFLAKKTGITRSQIQKLIENGNVLVNERSISQHHKVKVREIITITIPQEQTKGLIPELITLGILYEDDHLIVINKPAGMVVYPAAGHSHGTLMNALAYHCRKLATVGGPLRPGVVHRLDKDTSGVIVVALSDEAYYNLVEQFRHRTINRRYVVLVYGNLKEDQGEIVLSMGRSESDRKKMSTRVKKGKEAVTRWRVIKRFGIATLLEARLGTGRTHQIRVHFASIGHPVLGDKTYGKKIVVEVKAKKKISFPRQMLHAESLGFVHPETGEYMEFTSDLPEDIAVKIKELQDNEFSPRNLSRVIVLSA
jgi:23S rRNA pseudouridine1911/1915/1917 synthase